MKAHILRLLLTLVFPLLLTAQSRAEANIVTVAEHGADFTSIIDAVDSITDAGRNNPYVVSVAPGRYNLGATPLLMKDSVSLAGSGQNATYIIGSVDSVSSPTTGSGPGVINGANNSEIRHLTVINRYPGTAHAINNYGVSSRISDVTAIARGGGGSGAFKAGVWNDGGSHCTLIHVTSRAHGAGGAGPCFGLFNRESVARVHGGRLVANGCSINLGLAASEGSRVHVESTALIARGPGSTNNGVAVTSQSGLNSSAIIRNSTIRGAVMAANVDSSSVPAFVGISSSSIDGPLLETAPDGDIRCIGTFDRDFNPLTCP